MIGLLQKQILFIPTDIHVYTSLYSFGPCQLFEIGERNQYFLMKVTAEDRLVLLITSFPFNSLPVYEWYGGEYRMNRVYLKSESHKLH